MTQNVNATFSANQLKLDDVHPLEMFCLNASNSGFDPLYYVNSNQSVVGYSLNATGDLTDVETTYIGLPIKSGAIQSDIQGQIPSFSITIPNTDRVIESVIQSSNYLRGNTVYVINMFADNLPSGVTGNHVGTSPDKNSHIKEKLYIDSCSSNEEAVTFNLKNKFNIQNIVLPRRTYSRECHWALSNKYLGTECDPASAINSGTFPTCDGTLEQCKKRNNTARFGGFPSVPRNSIVVL